MVKRRKDPVTGKFITESEPNDKLFALRLPQSLLTDLKEAYGDGTAAFIRQAIAERLERELNNPSDSSDCNFSSVQYQVCEKLVTPGYPQHIKSRGRH